MYVPELFFPPVLGGVASPFNRLVDNKHVIRVFREHKFHEIITYQAFFPSQVFSFCHIWFCIGLGIYRRSVTVNIWNNCVTGFRARIGVTETPLYLCRWGHLQISQTIHFTLAVNYKYYCSHIYELGGQDKIFFKPP